VAQRVGVIFATTDGPLRHSPSRPQSAVSKSGRAECDSFPATAWPDVLFIVRAVDDFGYIAGDLTDDEVPVAAAISVSGDKDQFTFPPELAPALA
jgi:hypothetical protein